MQTEVASPPQTWRNRIIGTDEIDPKELLANPANWRIHPKTQQEALTGVLAEVGWVQNIIVNKRTGFVVDGHLRVSLALKAEEPRVPVVYVDLSPEEEKLVLATIDPIAALAETDKSKLDEVLQGISTQDEAVLKVLTGLAKEAGLEWGQPEQKDVEPQIDRAAELQKKWGTELGQLWVLDSGKGHPHRLICGDCTDKAVVERVMGGERAILIHADPPYGMGKENEGIANDNLYREKLDAFQMQWWKACRPHILDNGSIYIWGQSEDLWRLWYLGGLRQSERLTFRNEIVWNKKAGQGIGSDAHRMYPTVSERCLFFVLGEQGFSNNADNYWEGFAPIVDYLEGERQKAGWSIKDTKRTAGHSENSGCHWFDKSQWTMPTREVYEAWQRAANGDAFRREYDDIRREYDDIRREWYATRAPFDNTHDLMSDVWNFDTVRGEERQGHATPKPIAIMERIIKTSSRDGEIVFVPFAGTLPEVIACENLSRQCRAIELDPAYIAVALERWATLTHCSPLLVE